MLRRSGSASDRARASLFVNRAPRPLYRAGRTLVEWCLSAGALLALLPLLLVIGLSVKLTSPGPALYSQIRLGRRAKPFRIYKFRTMTHNCEAHTGAVWASDNDPRITRLGRFLRDTHLDELPQLWNVLRGDMSLVGPRPERPELALQIERVVPDFPIRLVVRPGLTGLAQMRLPADRELKRVRYKLDLDLHYIRHLGLWMDLRIIFCTLLVIAETACGSFARLLLGEYQHAEADQSEPESASRIDEGDASEEAEKPEPLLVAA